MGEDIIELAGMLFIIVLIIAIVQWFLLRFTHWSIALGATAFVALFITFVYVSLSHATPNGAGSGADLSEYIIPMLVIFGCLLCGLFVVAYATKTQLPKKTLFLIGGFIVVFAIGRYVYQYIDNATVYQEIFSDCEIEVVNKSGNRLVSEIAFKNTSNSLTSTINPNDSKQSYPVIPRNTDQIIFTCYSDKTGILMQDFPFDYRLCKEKEGEIMGLCFWLREKVVLPIKIVMNPNNKVDLYVNNQLVKQYQLAKEELPNDQKHKGKYK